MKPARRPRPRRTAPGEAPSAAVHVPLELDWVITTAWSYNGRHITPGAELSISGERGRFRFLRHVSRPNGAEWVDVIGGPQGAEAFRSFRPDRVRTVHRLAKTRANRAA